MKILATILSFLIVLIQYPLWFGDGSWTKVWKMEQDLTAERKANLAAKNRNAILAAEVKDLKQGLDAIEERARSELGMIKQDEVFFQIVESNHTNVSPEKENALADHRP